MTFYFYDTQAHTSPSYLMNPNRRARWILYGGWGIHKSVGMATNNKVYAGNLLSKFDIARLEEAVG